ncbi:MAG TPA: hypothetical protein VF950_25900 [Planctomycetota bacterium]
MRELRLELQGRRLVFPDGKAVCLACGAEPVGTRQVWFEDMSGVGLDRTSQMMGSVQALAGRITFDAPLCRAHRSKARMLSLGTALCGLAFIGMIALGMWIVGPTSARKPKTFWQQWPLALSLIPALPGYFLWQKKDRGGLRCEVRRDGENLVLSFPE